MYRCRRKIATFAGGGVMPLSARILLVLEVLVTGISVFYTTKASRHYTRQNRTFGLVSSVLVLILGGLYFWQESFRVAPRSTTAQNLARLDDVQKALRDLSQYVDQQKQEIRNTEATVKTLREEKTKLAPLVEGDRARVVEILQAVNSAQARSAWTDRAISFAIGVLSSVAAAGITWLVASRRRLQAPKL
jgi:hypothetical protein